MEAVRTMASQVDCEIADSDRDRLLPSPSAEESGAHTQMKEIQNLIIILHLHQ